MHWVGPVGQDATLNGSVLTGKLAALARELDTVVVATGIVDLIRRNPGLDSAGPGIRRWPVPEPATYWPASRPASSPGCSRPRTRGAGLPPGGHRQRRADR